MQQEVPSLSKPLQRRQEIPFHRLADFAAVQMLAEVSAAGPNLETAPREVFLGRGEPWIKVGNKLHSHSELVGVACFQGGMFINLPAHWMTSQNRLMSLAVTTSAFINW